MEELFEKILDKDEKVVKVFKPNKCKFFFSVFASWGFSLLIFALIGALAIIFPDEGVSVNKLYLLVPLKIYIMLIQTKE